MKELLPVALEAIAIAHQIVRERAPRSIVEKSARDLVTDVDLAVEDAVREFLARETPEIGLLGEEHGHTGPADDLWWVLDPVDGTSNFARGIPLCAVALGLVSARRSVVAAIDLPFLDVRYSAAEGHGAFIGDQRLRRSTVDELPRAMISIGDFAVGADAGPKNRVRLELLRLLGAQAQKVRMVGSAAIDLAWVADGKLDGTIILSNLPWDTMAGVLLVREAGGVVVDQDDTPHTADSSATIAVCAGLRSAVMRILHESQVD